MSVIFKYSFLDGSLMQVPFAEQDRVAHVGLDPATGKVALWILHAARPTEQTHPEQAFQIAGTGVEIPAGWSHVGSVIDVPYVWHVLTRRRHRDHPARRHPRHPHLPTLGAP